MSGARFDAILPLLKAQSYIKDVIYQNVPSNIDVDFSTFRHRYLTSLNLVELQGQCIGAHETDLSPWLEVKKSPISAGKVVIARSARYHNPKFDWASIIAQNAGRLLFVGLLDEYKNFITQYRLNQNVVKYQPTSNFLELAEIIAGSELFIGNQSAPCWTAMGIGHNLIQEVSPLYPNSQIKRPNAQFLQ